jgi:hypothetical protein
MENGLIQTRPTDNGKKALDVFHPSYRCKWVGGYAKDNKSQAEESKEPVDVWSNGLHL